jgi:glutaredoxin 3
MALPKAKEIVSSNPVVVFRFVFVYQAVSFFDLMISYTFMDVDFAVCNHSKTYCPFCVNVKQLLTQLGANFKAIELDTESEIFIFSFVFESFVEAAARIFNSNGN